MLRLAKCVVSVLMKCLVSGNNLNGIRMEIVWVEKLFYFLQMLVIT